jgi:hypothetical protein
MNNIVTKQAESGFEFMCSGLIRIYRIKYKIGNFMRKDNF